MPLKDKVKRYKYINEWAKKRRSAYFADKFCAICGIREQLELDHIDPKTKTSHHIWSWRESKRNSELKKCQVLCRSCHRKKTSSENKKIVGEFVGTAKLRNEDAFKIRLLYSNGGFSVQKLARVFKVSRRTIYRIVSNRSYNIEFQSRRTRPLALNQFGNQHQKRR